MWVSIGMHGGLSKEPLRKIQPAGFPCTWDGPSGGENLQSTGRGSGVQGKPVLFGVTLPENNRDEFSQVFRCAPVFPALWMRQAGPKFKVNLGCVQSLRPPWTT